MVVPHKNTRANKTFQRNKKEVKRKVSSGWGSGFCIKRALIKFFWRLFPIIFFKIMIYYFFKFLNRRLSFRYSIRKICPYGIILPPKKVYISVYIGLHVVFDQRSVSLQPTNLKLLLENGY